jgi:hypothetical protein
MRALKRKCVVHSQQNQQQLLHRLEVCCLQLHCCMCHDIFSTARELFKLSWCVILQEQNYCRSLHTEIHNGISSIKTLDRQKTSGNLERAFQEISCAWTKLKPTIDGKKHKSYPQEICKRK